MVNMEYREKKKKRANIGKTNMLEDKTKQTHRSGGC